MIRLNCKAALGGVADERGARFGGGLCVAKQGQKTHAVLGRAGGDGGSDEIGAGGEEVELPDEGVRSGAGWNGARPVGDERHAVPALEQIGLEAAVAGARVVRDARVRRDVGGGGEAVVGGKNHERIFGEAVSF